MLDPSDLFQPSDHVEPALRSEAATDRVLLVTLGSHGDAGESQALVDDHLLEQFANLCRNWDIIVICNGSSCQSSIQKCLCQHLL